MPFVEVRDLSMYHEVHGTGPPVLHISGSGNDLRTAPASLSPLNDHFTGLHYDQRGLGQTSPGSEVPTMADFADDAAALCTKAGWGHCHVVGTSFGGMVALNLALRHPALIDRLVLNCTSPGGAMASYPLHRLAELPPEQRAERSLEIMDTRYDPAAEEPIPGFGDLIDYLRRRAAGQTEGDAAIGSSRQMEARRHHDVLDRLDDIQAPTLVCCGRYDGIAPQANSEVLASRIPDARLELFDGGHAFMIQDPSAHEVMVEFLST